jgi:hypothetical protein
MEAAKIARHLSCTLSRQYRLLTKPGQTMATANNALERVNERLKVRGDTFLDSDGEALLGELKTRADEDEAAAKAIKEIEHRRSQKVE